MSPRDFVQRSADGRYFIIRLNAGERIIIRGSSGNDVLIEADGIAAMDNTFHLSKIHFDFDGQGVSLAPLRTTVYACVRFRVRCVLPIIA